MPFYTFNTRLRYYFAYLKARQGELLRMARHRAQVPARMHCSKSYRQF